jgi:hypothetical protein
VTDDPAVLQRIEIEEPLSPGDALTSGPIVVDGVTDDLVRALPLVTFLAACVETLLADSITGTLLSSRPQGQPPAISPPPSRDEDSLYECLARASADADILTALVSTRSLPITGKKLRPGRATTPWLRAGSHDLCRAITDARPDEPLLNGRPIWHKWTAKLIGKAVVRPLTAACRDGTLTRIDAEYASRLQDVWVPCASDYVTADASPLQESPSLDPSSLAIVRLPHPDQQPEFPSLCSVSKTARRLRRSLRSKAMLQFLVSTLAIPLAVMYQLAQLLRRDLPRHADEVNGSMLKPSLTPFAHVDCGLYAELPHVRARRFTAAVTPISELATHWRPITASYLAHLLAVGCVLAGTGIAGIKFLRPGVFEQYLSQLRLATVLVAAVATVASKLAARPSRVDPVHALNHLSFCLRTFPAAWHGKEHERATSKASAAYYGSKAVLVAHRLLAPFCAPVLALRLASKANAEHLVCFAVAGLQRTQDGAVLSRHATLSVLGGPQDPRNRTATVLHPALADRHNKGLHSFAALRAQLVCAAAAIE